MSIQTHHSAQDIIPLSTPIYLTSKYLGSQPYNQFIAFSNEDFFIAFDIIHREAISIPRSPFGSFCCRNGTEEGIENFWKHVKEELKTRDIDQVVMRPPIWIYNSFASVNKLETLGFRQIYSDVNQHISLSEEWPTTIHNMQRRKLEMLKKEGFIFQKIPISELKVAHDFLSVCRQAQGVPINISYECLHKLTQKLPDCYDIFAVLRDGKISALCIAVNVTSDTAYYYLPGTSPLFRNKSPMVLLIAGMVEHYIKRGLKFLDMGVSSKEGVVQHTLKLFKERMGAIEAAKPTLVQSL